MSRMSRALERVGVSPTVAQLVFRETQDERVATPRMDVAGFTVQVTSPRESVRLRDEVGENATPDLDADGARRLGICLLFAAEYIETKPATAEETLESIERLLDYQARGVCRGAVAEALQVIREWKAER